MINETASKISKLLSGPVSDSKYFEEFSKDEIENIITYNMVNNIKQWIWIIALLLSTWLLLIAGIDIRFTTLIIFITIVAFRSRFGGYHADSAKVCIIISTIIPIVCAYITIFLDFNLYLIVTVYIFAYFTAFKKGVVDHPNRRFQEGNKILNLEMKRRLFKTGVILLVAINIIHIHLFLIGYVSISDAMTLGTLISFINLYFGK
ncbi:accessory gene regulator B family protein [Wukongibacter sp. M2B1]|uniref:accessory gene regulator B family protein n=1 Tax=Wukongibacter sp. M2B1 TaxID=3088895 RepID=UPI003D7A9E0E